MNIEIIEGLGVLIVLNSAAAVATICGAVIAFVGLIHQLSRPRHSTTRRRSFSPNRKEVLLIVCLLLFFFLGMAIPQSILPIFLILMIIVYINLQKSKERARYTMALLAVMLAGLAGAYLSAFSFATESGLPIFYSHDFRVLDIWYLLN